MSTESFIHEYCYKIHAANVNTLPDLFLWVIDFPEDQIDPEHIELFRYLQTQIVKLIDLCLEEHKPVAQVKYAAAVIIANLGEAAEISPPTFE